MHIITEPSDLEALFVPRTQFVPSDSYLIVADNGATFLHEESYMVKDNGPRFIQTDDDTYTACTAADIMVTCDSVLVIKFDQHHNSGKLVFDNLKSALNSELS